MHNTTLSPSGHNKRNKRKRESTSHFEGFTLIELLVVISIVAILAALLIPSITSARRSALTASSTGNLHHIHNLMQNYLSQNNEMYPNAADWTGTNPVLPGQGGLAVTWRRLIWEAANPSPGFWNPVDWKTGYHSTFWCPLMTSKYGSVTDYYYEGYGSYAMHPYFHCYDAIPSRIRRSVNMQGMGKLVPYVIAGDVDTNNANSAKIGTSPYMEPQSGSTWYHIAWKYGSKQNMALGLYLDGNIQLIDQTNKTTLEAGFNNDSQLP